MLAEGLLEEARGLIPCRNLNSLQTVGYRELFDHFDGKISLEQAITDIKTNTRRYAKRQITWFQRDEEIHWEHPDNLQTLISKAEESL
jgi:tRNA dimethylallyltransferase